MRSIALVLLMASASLAAEFTAVDATRDEVQDAIDLSSSGDTVYIPAGEETWTSGVTLKPGVALIGAGIGQTVINVVWPTPGSSNTQAILVSPSGGDWRISGMTIHQDTTNFSAQCINSNQPGSTGFRIDHISFENISSRAIIIGPQSGVSPTGLIDHCYFEAPFNLTAQTVTLRGSDVQTPPSYNASGNYTLGTISFGNADAVFVEDCDFDFEYPNDAGVELYAGMNATVRYNTFRNSSMGVHGRDSTQRSAHTYEFYSNVITIDVGSQKPSISQIRGGTGVFYDNTATVTGTGASSVNQLTLSEYRATQNTVYSAVWLDGSEPTDGNAADGPTASGTHDGSDNASDLVDSSKSWTTDEWNHGGTEGAEHQPHFVWNRTDGSGGFVTANTATTLTATLAGGTDNDWDDGDEYVITFGYPGLDQVGWIGPTAFNGTYATQTLSPIYQWDNTFNGSGTGAFPFVVQFTDGSQAGIVPRADQFLVEDREFYNDTEMPGYSPYTYPHPLQGIVGGSVTATTATIGTLDVTP